MTAKNCLCAMLAVMCATGGWQAATAQAPGVTSLAFVHTTVIDATGTPARPDQTVVVSGNRITAIGSFGTVAIPPGARIVDATGRFLIPGLWDTHVHTRYQGIDHTRLFVANGITSVRNMSAPWEHLAEVSEWRREIEAGRRIGPRLLTASPVFDGPGTGRATNLMIGSPEEGREAVRRAAREGADFIKVYNLLAPETFAAIASEARMQGLPFAGHVPLLINTADAVAAGQRTLEHVDTITLGTSGRESELRQGAAGWRPSPGVRGGPFDQAEIIESFSREKLLALAGLLRQRDAAFVPTLIVVRNRTTPRIPPDGVSYVPSAYLDVWKQAAPGASNTGDRLIYVHAERLLRDLAAEGVTILAGTDVGTPFQVSGFGLHEELSLLVTAGLSEMKALQAATRDPARVLGVRDLGTIEVGMIADLVLLDANPLESIENTRTIRSVVTAGRLFERAELDSMLVDIEKAAREWRGTPTR